MKIILTSIGLLLFSAISTGVSFGLTDMGKALGGWSHKDGTAAEYKSADSNYRTYKPTVTPTPDGGLFISTKIDHIRSLGGDDHCQLEITFDKDGKVLSSRADITMGDKSFNTGIITASTAAASGSAGTTAVIALGAEIAKKLQDQISKWNEHGGRANFPAVVKHNYNIISNNVKSLPSK